MAILADGHAALTTSLVPILLTLIGLAGAVFQITPILSLSSGALWTYVLFRLWSVGSYFIPAALALTVATIVAAGTHRVRINSAAVSMSIWCLVGVTGICALVALYAKSQEYRVVMATSVSEHHIDLPIVLQVGAVAFPVLLLGLGLLQSIRLWRSDRRVRRT
jgi:hypothetical protein